MNGRDGHSRRHPLFTSTHNLIRKYEEIADMRRQQPKQQNQLTNEAKEKDRLEKS